jgi:hypothetical protein
MARVVWAESSHRPNAIFPFTFGFGQSASGVTGDCAVDAEVLGVEAVPADVVGDDDGPTFPALELLEHAPTNETRATVMDNRASLTAFIVAFLPPRRTWDFIPRSIPNPETPRSQACS